jgi:hypothetical protein
MGESIQVETLALPTHKFDGYMLRPAMQADREKADRWCGADPEHRWEAKQKDFWIKQILNVNCYVLEDADGPIFFVRLFAFRKHYILPGSTEKCIEISLQIPPWRERTHDARIRLALERGMRWLEKTLPGNGFDTVYFASKNARTLRFATLRLGFRREGEQMKRTLVPVDRLGMARKDT